MAAHILVARASAHLLVLTTQGRAFRLPVATLPRTEVRGRGGSLPDRLALAGDGAESLGALLALDDDQDAGKYLLIATAQGWVHRLRSNYVGPRLQPGSQLFDPRRGGGAPAAMALAGSDDDVLVALRSGIGIRFGVGTIRRGGVLGIQVQAGDAVAGISGVQEDGCVLLATAEGKGIRREMSGFRANKSPGGQGKILMRTDALVGASAVGAEDEVLCISDQAKVIRFAAAEISTTAGSVQGNSLMDCRGSCLAAFAVVPPPE
jgi:DNA gyrase subunit A